MTSAAFPEADAYVLLDEGHLKLVDPERPSAGSELTSVHRVQVLTPAGRRHSRVSLSLSPWEELRSVAARSYRPGDPNSVRELPIDAVAYRAAAPAAGILYFDARIAEFDVPSVEVGDIIETEVTIRRNQAFHLTRWSFDGRDPVRTSRLTVDVPLGWTLGWGFWDGAKRGELEPTRTSLPGLQRLVFEQSNLQARAVEPQAPPFSGWRRRLDLAVAEAPGVPGEDRFGRWEDIGSWYRRLTAERDEVENSQWAAVQRALGASPTPEDLFAFVRDRTRYVALYEDDLASFRPHAASAVFDARFGDCKDMGTLLVALLRRAGVEAHPALVGVADRVFFDENHPSVSAFNHLVVAVPRWLPLSRPDGQGGALRRAPLAPRRAGRARGEAARVTGPKGASPRFARASFLAVAGANRRAALKAFAAQG